MIRNPFYHSNTKDLAIEIIYKNYLDDAELQKIFQPLADSIKNFGKMSQSEIAFIIFLLLQEAAADDLHPTR